MSGEKDRGKILERKSRKNFVGKKFSHLQKIWLLFPDIFFPDKVVVSDRFKHSDEGFKYFIGYQEGEIVKPLYIILPQMSDT